MSAETRGIRELARAYFNERHNGYANDPPFTDGELNCYTSTGMDVVNDITAFAESIVEQCCKDVCGLCALGNKPKQIKHTAGHLYWHHESEHWAENGDCEANAIRSHWQRGEGQ